MDSLSASGTQRVVAPAGGFRVIASNPPGFPRAEVAVAASRAGAIGILDLTLYDRTEGAAEAIGALVRAGRGDRGLRLSSRPSGRAAAVLGDLPAELGWIVLDGGDRELVEEWLPTLGPRGVRVLVEVVSAAEAGVALAAGAHGLIAKGHEAGGRVGEETTFVLLQRLLRAADVPVWARGGIGVHSAAACLAAGAAGVCLDWQLASTREGGGLPEPLREAARRADGSESLCLGAELGEAYRVYHRPGRAAGDRLLACADELARAAAADSAGRPKILERWRGEVERTARDPEGAWAVGQDLAFAQPLAAEHVTVGGVVQAIRDGAAAHVAQACASRPLAEGSALARSHGTRFPVLQGPMTRVSDRAAFARAVSDGGGLPFLALALLRAPAVRELLEETRELLGDRPWGVGILGFVPLALRQEQLEEIGRCRPAFALIAGGRPDQAAALERQGVPTYLHVPSPGLLRLFLADGARRFVFEGRECGGHVGPRTSFVLWDEMVDTLLEVVPESEAASCHVVFAGGIHDARSAAMVAALAAPLAARGMRIGVLMGTAYLFTREAVATGAIVEGFQQEAVACSETVLLETGPGHATRCSRGPFAELFRREKERLRSEGRSAEEMREALERLNLGRLRVAAKGIDRAPEGSADGARHVAVDAARQREDGLYMIGQVAALEGEIRTLEELHRDVSTGATDWLAAVAVEPIRPAQRRPAPANVAIVGIGTLLPGASDLRAFWHNVLAKVDAVGEVPPERWDSSLYHDPDRSARDKIVSRAGGFLAEVPFDPLSWGLPPAALRSIEPVQLLTLELVRAALEDAGYGRRALPRLRTSVLLGAGGGVADLGNAYAVRAALPSLFAEVPEGVLDRLPEWTEDSFAGILLNVAAGRVANRFDLGGINCTVDAACASSLAAVYMACQELETGSSDVVIAGGVDTVQNPFGYLCFSKTQALSPRGRCRTFDADADGIAISEGLVALVLKRRDDAERDGDRIYAVIQGVAASSDGRAKGLTAPRPEGQARALRRAYEKAGFSPATVSLVEAHGTGTVAGDRAEVETMTQVFAGAGAATAGCALGSVKSMIGHTKCAAGAAGLAKVALALHHRVLPPTLHVERPGVAVADGPFYLNTELRPWIEADPERPRRAGVSAFGFGGTNFHVAVEEYRDDVPGLERRALADVWPAELFLFRAPAAELPAELHRIAEALDRGARPTPAELAWLVARRAARASAGSATLAIVAAGLDELREAIGRAGAALAAHREPGDGRTVFYSPDRLAGAGRLAFLYPGQGSQYPDMLRELAVHFPSVREAFEEADRALAGRWDRPLSGFVFPPPSFTPDAAAQQREALTRTDVAQPALGAAAVGLHRLLGELGIRPDHVAGHSYGEYVALWAAGVVDADLLPQLSFERGRAILDAAQGGLGGMVAVAAPADAVPPLVAGIDGLWVANYNAPRQVILSGTEAGLEAALERLDQAGVAARRLPVGCGFHSPLVAPARDRLGAVLAEARLAAPALPVYSNATGGRYPEDVAGARALLVDQLVSPVRFQDEIETMYEAGARIFVEVGPKSVLTRLVGEILAGRSHVAIAAEEAGATGVLGWLRLLARLATEGVAVDPARLFRGRALRRLELESLLEETRERELPATAWLVSGGRVRRADEPAARPAPYRLPEAPRVPEPASVTDLAPFEAPAVSAPYPSGFAAEAGAPVTGGAAVVLRYQRFLGNLVSANEEVMMAYLGRREAPAPDLEAPVVAAGPVTPAPVAAMARNGGDAPAPRVPADDLGAPGAAVIAGAHLGAPPAPAAADAANGHGASADPWRLLLEVVSERTGYPPEILTEERSLEADLGIDSIKRVEILGALRARLPLDNGGGVGAFMERLGEARSLGAMAGILRETLGSAAAPADRDPRAAAASPAGSGVEAAPQAPVSAPEVSPSDTEEPVPRFVLEVREAPRCDRVPLPAGACVLVDDGAGVGEQVASTLRARGTPVAMLRDVPGSAGEPGAGDLADAATVASQIARVRAEHPTVSCLVHLGALAATATDGPIGAHSARESARAARSLYLLARELRGDLEASGGVLVAASALGGRFGVDGDAAAPAAGALGGLMKVLALEWPRVRTRALDLDREDTAEALAGFVVAELETGGTDVEVGRTEAGRQVLRPRGAPLPEPGPVAPLDADAVILVTGGARGITAAVAHELARRHRPRIVLAGRSAPPSETEDPATAGVRDMGAIKRALIDVLARRGETVHPAAVEGAYRRLLAEREMRATFADLRAAGSTVEYVQLDVRDEAAVAAVVAGVRARHGRLDGIVHGAGVIEDKLLQDKEPESWDRVFGTKVDGALALARAVEAGGGPADLRYFVLFASVAGTFGNRGQSDYAAANEALCRLAAALDRRWPETRVVAVAWGPWGKTGMASAEVQRQFAARGVQLIPPAAGARALAEELARGPKGEPIVILGGGPWDESRAGQDVPLLRGVAVGYDGGRVQLTRELDPVRDHFLADHLLDGRPVLPAAAAMELLAETAVLGWPDLQVVGLRDFRVQQGVVLEGGRATIRLSAHAPEHAPGEGPLPVTVEIHAVGGDARASYRGVVELAERLPAAPPFVPPGWALEPCPLEVPEIYERFLFHGPLFAAITAVRGFGRPGVVAELRPSDPAQCLAGGSGRWLIDPVVVDGSFQLAILWERLQHDLTPLPSRFEHYRRFGPMDGERLTCYLEASSSNDGHSLLTRHHFVGADGRLVGLLEGMESTCSSALNRLADGPVSLRRAS